MIRAFVVFFFLMSFTPFSEAYPNVSVEKINGFEVHFVDVGVGNYFGLSFQVPYGSFHDYGRFLGRAHLLEHLLHVGSLKFPGYNTFSNNLHPVGVSTNAYTFYNQTYYFAEAKEDQAELVIPVFLSMLGGLEWNPETVEKQREVVINEVVHEGLPQSGTAFLQMPFTQLLPISHPMNNPHSGSLNSLKNLSLQDLQRLYNEVYNPQETRVSVFGNFSNPVFLKQVKLSISQNLRASPRQNGKPVPFYNLANREIPSLFSANHDAPESQKSLYIESNEGTSGLIILEADRRSDMSKNSVATEILTRYLEIDAPGSLFYQLKNDLGWINGGWFDTFTVRNKQFLYFCYGLSEEGRSHEREVNELFFQALASMQQTDVDPQILNILKKELLHEDRMASRYMADLINHYNNMLNLNRSQESYLNDINGLSSSDIRSIAQSFRPDLALYVSAGAEVPEMLFDQNFRRKYKLKDNRAALEKYVAVFHKKSERSFSPQLKPIELDPPLPPSGRFFFRSDDGSVVADIRGDLSGTSLQLQLQLSPQTPSDLTAMELALIAFKNRYSPELTFFNLIHQVSATLYIGGSKFRLSVQGEDGYSAKVLSWIVDQMSHFIPTDIELEKARHNFIINSQQDFAQSFSADVGLEEMTSLINPFLASTWQTRSHALALTSKQILEVSRSQLNSAKLTLVAVGALNLKDLKEISSSFSEGNSPSQTSFAWQSPVINWKHEPNQEMHFPAPKGEDSYASVRTYRGPKVTDLKDHAAFTVLKSFLSKKLYDYNRGEQGLGYVHSSSTQALDHKHLFLFLFGGTEGEKNLKLTQAGWEHILNQIRTGEADQEIADSISAVLNESSIQKTSAAEWSTSYMTGLNLAKDPHLDEKLLEEIRHLTVEDVRSIAYRYLLNDGTAYRQLTLHGCENLLNP